MNTQPIEKLDQQADGSLEVHSIFYTIQGEGPFTGHPAVFVRLAGCNLQCPGCDTDYTSKRERVSVKEILSLIRDECEEAELTYPPKLVVVTGGEPFRQNLSILCNSLVAHGAQVQIETNGTLPKPAGLMDRDITIVCSPKTANINRGVVNHIHSLKYVAKAGQIAKDGLPTRALDNVAVPCLARPPEHFAGRIYLQPMDECNTRANASNTKAVVDSCLKHGHTLQLQVHKIVNLE